MEKFSITSRREFDQVIDHAGQFIFAWMQKEFREYSKNKFIIRQLEKECYQIKDFIIGRTEDNNWAVFHDFELVHQFSNKTAGLFYCICWIESNIVLAKEILTLDQNLSHLLSDHDFYSLQLKRYKKNPFKFETTLSRYQQNSQRINIIRHRLEKILDHAKYKKTRNSYEP